MDKWDTLILTTDNLTVFILINEQSSRNNIAAHLFLNKDKDDKEGVKIYAILQFITYKNKW